MINLDDLDPTCLPTKPRDLQPLSVEELESYIATLEQEIIRADAMIAQKQAHKNGLDALFGKASD